MMRVALAAAIFFSVFGISEPATLSLTGFYSDDKVAYEPQYPLWSDGAVKQRWLYLPPDTKINTGKVGTQPPPHMGNMNYWIFPVGTKIWKEFSFPKKEGGLHRVETRFMQKLADGSWQFATYFWNEEESVATLVGEEGQKDVYPINHEVKHDIPGRADCLRCHNRGGDMVLGLDTVQLSSDRDPMALHVNPGSKPGITLETLAAQNRVTYFPPSVLQTPPTIVSSTPLGRAAMGYLHANCGNCHNPTGTSTHSYLYFRYPWNTPTEAKSPVFQSAIDRIATVIKIPNVTETFQIKPGDPDASAVVYALEASPDHPMPPIGVKVKDNEAIRMLREWIKSL